MTCGMKVMFEQAERVLLCRCVLSPAQQSWAAFTAGFSAFGGDLPVPPPLVSTLVCTDVGQRCLFSRSHFVGVLWNEAIRMHHA